MQTKHTPGPWQHVGLTMIQGRGDPHNNIPGIVANVTPPGDLHRADVCDANARLIAAAPELLAALKIAHRHPERQHEPGEMPNDCSICAAIAKAESGA